MTAKRFKLGYVCGDFGLIDNAQSKGNQWIDLHSMSENSEKNIQICINKMNELAEENEQLKQQKQQYKGQRDYLLFVIERTCSKELFEETKSYLKEVE